MTNGTKIEWADETWNPSRGCTRVIFKQWGQHDEHGVRQRSKKVAGRLLDGLEWSQYPDVIQAEEVV